MPASLEQLRAFVRQDGVRLDGSGKGKCPLHEDDSPSLSTYLGKDGRGRWKCHAGCGGGDAADWLQRVRGLSQREALQLANPEGGRKGDTPWDRYGEPHVTTHWVGPDERTAEQYRWNKDDGSKLEIRWKKGTKKDSIVYVARRSGEDLLPDALVFAEGAKAAQSLADRGIASCGIVDGAQPPSYKAVKWLAALVGKRHRWVLWPDNDEVGRNGMLTLAERAAKAGIKDIRLVTPLESEQEHDDAADWTGDPLERIGSAIQFVRGKRPAALGMPDAPQGLEWDAKDGVPDKNSRKNTEVFFALEKVGIRFDTFDMRPQVLAGQAKKWAQMENWHVKQWYGDAKESYGFEPTPVKQWVWHIETIARRQTVHSVVEYLDGCPKPAGQSEATQLLRDLAIEGFSVKESDWLSMMCLQKTMCAAVRRVRQPGCDWKYVPVLISKQDRRKSSAIKALVPERRWMLHRLDLADRSKEISELMLGKWLIELKELDGMRKAGVEKLKAFIDSPTDSYRTPYDIMAHDQDRQCIFFGTSNNYQFLMDPTGNVRFWPVYIDPESHCDPDWINEHRDALWGAAALLEPETNLWPDNDMIRKQLEERQEEARVMHPWEDRIRQNWWTDMTGSELLGKIGAADTRGNAMILADILRSLGYTSSQTTRIGTDGAKSRARVWHVPSELGDGI